MPASPQVGVCNALTGHCTCPAGWRSFNCIFPQPRYCTHEYRQEGFVVERTPPNWTQADAMDPRTHCVGEPRRTGPSSILQAARLGLLRGSQEADAALVFPERQAGPAALMQAPITRSAANPAGFCDETIGACYCPSNTTYGRIPAPEDAPLDAPPVRLGRPMNWWCQPKGSYGGTREWEDIYGPQGWCMAEDPKIECECNVPGERSAHGRREACSAGSTPCWARS